MKNKTAVTNTKQIICLILLISVLLLIAGNYLYRHEAERMRHQKEQLLTSIANSKIQQISSWYQDELYDAYILAKSPFLKEKIENCLNSNSYEHRKYLESYLEQLRDEHDYAKVLITTLEGELLFASDGKARTLTNEQLTAIGSAIQEDRSLTSELYICHEDKSTNIDFISPVFLSNQQEDIVVLVCVMDISLFLKPLIDSWPVPSNTAESYIFKISNDSLKYLSELKYLENATLNYKLPLDNTKITSIAAALGHTGIIEGLDYRGVEVFAYTSSVPGTPWFLVSEIDKSELLEGLVFKAVMIFAVTLLLICLVGVSITYFYKRNRAEIYKTLYINEKELNKYKNNFKAIMDSLGDGVITIDKSGIILYMNPRAEDLCGWDVTEATGMKFTEIYRVVDEETGLLDESIVESVLNASHQIVSSNPLLLLTKLGKELPVQDTRVPIFDVNGDITEIAISFRDESEIRNHQRQLIISEASLKRAQTAAKIGSWELDFSTNQLSWTEEVYNIFEIDSHKFSASYQSFLDLVHPMDRELVKTAFEESLQNKSPYHIDHRLLMHDGRIKYVHEQGETIFSAAGNPIRTIGIVQDITVRKRAELKTLENERFQSTLLNTIGDAIVVTSLPNRTIVHINRAAENMFGWKIEELQNRNIRILYKNEDTYTVYGEKIERIIQKNESILEPDLEMISKDGKSIFCEVHSTFIRNDDDSILVINAYRDITERKKIIHDLIISKEKAEESDRLKSAFLANMSHEIRTPLNGIMGFSELLLNTSLSEGKKVQFIKILRESSQRMLDTINDIIEISRIDSGTMDINIGSVNVNNLMNYYLRFFKPEAEKKGLKLFLSLPENEHSVMIHSDETKLASIISNLIKNAIKFTVSGSVTFGYNLNPDKIVFFTKDTGPGIPKEKHQHIFSRFVQGDYSLSSSYEGLGLGLSIAKSYTEMLGGRIWLDSKEGEGSTFSFSIPVNTQKRDLNLKVNQLNEVLQTEQGQLVLIAEDDNANYYLTKELLEMNHFRTLRAENGEQAIKICQSRTDIDLILMDLKMPVMDGLVATSKIRSFNREIPIIALTAYALSGDKEKAMEVGCNDYVTKPISPNKLLITIREHIEQIEL